MQTRRGLTHGWTMVRRKWLLLVAGGALGLTSAEAQAATLCVNAGGTEGCNSTIQAAIDTASSGDTINVYPGTYDQDEANGRNPDTGGAGSNDFNIFVNKALTIQGVDASGTTIASSGAVVANVAAKRALPTFGQSTFFVQADGVTITGLEISGWPGTENNKTIEAVGDNFTLKFCKVHGMDSAAAVYIDDRHYNAGTDTSHVQTYRIEANLLDGGGTWANGIRISNGAGWSGPVSGRVITANTFTNCVDGIGFVGPGADPWDIYPVGAATITSNTFTGNDRRHIIAWGTYHAGLGYGALDWEAILSANSFDRAVTVWTPGAEARAWNCAGCGSAGDITNIVGIYTAIQRYPINRVALAGDTIRVAAGTYAEAVDVNKSIALVGAGVGVSILDVAGKQTSASSGVYIGVADATLQGFTVLGNSLNPPRYGVKVGQVAGVTLDHLRVQNIYRTGIDVLGAIDITLSDIESLNNGGAGLFLTDVKGAAISNVTTSGNAWAGMTVATWGRYSVLGTNGIVISGSNSFGEDAGGNGGLQLEEGNFSDPTHPSPITFSNAGGDGAAVTITGADFAYALGGPQDDGQPRRRFYQTIAEAQNAAAGSPDHFLGHDRYIQDADSFASTTHFYVFDVTDDKMSIQAAVNAASAGDTIEVAGGTYNQTNIAVTKSLTIRGDVSGACPGPGLAAPEIVGSFTGSERGFIINPGVDDVIIEGFVIRDMGVVPQTEAGGACGIWAYDTTANPTEHITVRNNAFRNIGWTHVFFYNEAQSAYNDINVSCNTVDIGVPNYDGDYGGNQYGIECTNCVNATISDNEVSGGDIGILLTAQTGTGRTMTADNNTISRNTISNSGMTNIYTVPWSLGGAAPTLQNISIIDNHLSNSTSSILIYNYAGSVVRDYSIAGNDITVTSPSSGARMVLIRSVGGSSTFEDNSLALTGTAPPSFLGLQVDGSATGNWTIQGNSLSGGNASSDSAGIRLKSTLPATSTIDVECNRIEGWANGIQSDALANYALVDVHQNAISGNSDQGFRDGGSLDQIDAENNWWGCAGGPGNPGCNGITGNVDSDPIAASVPPCVSCNGAADGAACNDDDACTQTDACQTGTCTGTNPVVCSALDQCHDVGTCDTSTGVCSDPNKPNGDTCNDGDACTQTDTCQTGTCTGTNPVVCSALDQCHDVGTCDTSTGVCSDPNKPNGDTCNDGDACTQTDACQTGTCTGTNPVVCTALDQCHIVGTCDSGSGLCSNPDKLDGEACNDGSACTQTDTCQTGSCTGTNPVVCTALDQCHNVGTCDTGSGACSNPNKPDGSACNDGDLCTQADQCTGGVCTGGTVGDTDGDGYCDDQEAAAGCSPTDPQEIPPQANVQPGTRGMLLTYRAPEARSAQTASDPSCTATGGVCTTPFCTGGKISDPCSTDADCDLPADTCRVVINFADVADLTFDKAELKVSRQPRMDVLSSFSPATPGCSRKVDLSLSSGFRLGHLRLRAKGTLNGRMHRETDTLIYHEE